MQIVKCSTLARRVHKTGAQARSQSSVTPAKSTACASDTQQEYAAVAWVQQETGVVIDKDLHVRLDTAQHNVELLMNLRGKQRVSKLLAAHPDLLSKDLDGWASFLQAYGVTPHAFFKLLGTHTELFTEGSLFTAGRSISYLQSLGLSTRDISAHVVPRAAELLQSDPSVWAPVVAFLTAEPCSVGENNQGGQMATDNERHHSNQSMPADSVSDRAAASGRSTQSLSSIDGGIGLEREELCSLISRCPRVLLSDLDDLRHRLWHLRGGLGLDAQQAKHLLLTHASLLHGAPIEGPISSVLSFLTHTCGLPVGAARQVLICGGDLVTLSEGNRSRKWAFLCHQICGPATQAAIASVSEQAVQNAAAQLLPDRPAAFAEQQLDFTAVEEHNSAQVPAAEGCLGVEEQAPPATSEGVSGAVARVALLQCPTYFSYSLLNHIGPRFAWARDRGLLHSLLQHVPEHGMTFSLAKLLEPSNGVFLQNLHGDEADFEQYAKQWRRTEGASLTVTSSTMSERSW